MLKMRRCAAMLGKEDQDRRDFFADIHTPLEAQGAYIMFGIPGNLICQCQCTTM
jgi:hypothetical protein